MADKDDDIYDEGEFEDDGTADIIRQIIEKSSEDEPEEDDGGFDQPLKEPTADDDDTVSAEKGNEILSEAQLKKSRRANAKEQEAPEPEAKSTKTEKPADAKAEPADKEKAPAGPDLSSASVDDLLDGLADDRRGEVAKRLKDAEAALAPFQSEYAQSQMKQFGSTPAEMAARLTQLAQFAQDKPDEYIAWVASQMAADEDKIGDVLSAAAKHLGFKVVREDADGADGADDDDPFMSDRERELLEENRRLKAAQGGKPRSFGPDTPERVQKQTFQAQMEAFVNEVGEDGTPKRPLFDTLQPIISARAKAQRDSTGAPVTFEDLGKIYDAVVSEMQSNIAPSIPRKDTSAATQGSGVASERQRKAAAAEKAMRASKSVDGSGQGASRRLALPESADPTDVIRALVAQSE